MNISDANTEAYAIFRKSHNNLNLTIKVALGGLLEIKRIVENDASGGLLSNMVDQLNMPWGVGKPFPNGSVIIEKATRNYIYNSYVQAIGNFEYFITHLIADLAHFSNLHESGQVFEHAHILNYNFAIPPVFAKCCFAYAEQVNTNYGFIGRLEKIKNDINIVNVDLDNLLPLFKYLWLMRNSIVHLDSMANKDLCDYYLLPELQTSYNYWNTNFARGKSPLLPTPSRGHKIQLDATHSIMCSAICFEVAKIYNEKAIQILGIDGLVKMATYYGLILMDHDYRYERTSSSAESVISNYLTNRYHVFEVDTEELIQDLIKNNLWKISRQMFVNYPNKSNI